MSIAPEITAIHSPYLSSSNTGLGNCLFQIASVYGIGKKYRQEVYYDTVVELGNKLYHLFNFNHLTTIFRNFTRQSRAPCTDIQETEWRKVDTALLETISTNQSIHYMIRGYLEVPSYFKDSMDELRTLFSPDENSHSYLQLMYPFLFDSVSEPTVAVHIRSYKELHHPDALVTNYYREAIKKVEEHVSNPHYIVFTDYDGTTIDFLEGKNYTVIHNPFDYLDLWCMAACSHYILSQSTFSYWGWVLNPSKTKFTVVPTHPKLNFYEDEDVCVV